MTKEEFRKALLDDVDPLKYAGEGWYATDEYARPDDISSPYVRGDIGHEEEYYPRPQPRRKRR